MSLSSSMRTFHFEIEHYLSLIGDVCFSFIYFSGRRGTNRERELCGMQERSILAKCDNRKERGYLHGQSISILAYKVLTSSSSHSQNMA